MWTNQNTPLGIALAVAAGVLALGVWIGGAVALGIAVVLAVLVLGMGLLSRRMTGMWLTDDVRLWVREIHAFERADQRAMPRAGSIVFTGSSTIRYWHTLADDMHPLPVIRRGFGGSRLLDAVHYADRIVMPYNPAAVVLFSGTNDLAGKLPKTPEYVAEQFANFCAVVHAQLPEVPIYFVGITPTPGRREHWPAVQRANALVAAYTQTDERLHFIDTTAAFLDADGHVQRQLYRWDRLHLNADGYALLTACIKPVLAAGF